MKALRKIISGGQTGADRAGLDWAIANGIPHGGYCPKGRIAEDGTIPAKYQLEETKRKDYPTRTKANAKAADGTIIFTMGPKLTSGSKLTATAAEAAGKPWLHVWATAPRSLTVQAVRAFIADHSINVLNIAGSRESTDPAIVPFTMDVLQSALTPHCP